MLELLFAILISLGYNFDRSLTAEELQSKDPVAYEQALKIEQTGKYKLSGGVVILETGGD